MNLIESHKIVAVTLLIGVIGSAVGIAVISQPVDNQVRDVSNMVTAPKEGVEDTPPVTAPGATLKPVSEAPAVEVVDVPVIEAEVSIEPVTPRTMSDMSDSEIQSITMIESCTRMSSKILMVGSVEMWRFMITDSYGFGNIIATDTGLKACVNYETLAALGVE